MCVTADFLQDEIGALKPFYRERKVRAVGRLLANGSEYGFKRANIDEHTGGDEKVEHIVSLVKFIDDIANDYRIVNRLALGAPEHVGGDVDCYQFAGVGAQCHAAQASPGAKVGNLVETKVLAQQLDQCTMQSLGIA